MRSRLWSILERALDIADLTVGAIGIVAAVCFIIVAVYWLGVLLAALLA
jgi:hypothetical protein